MKKTFLSFSIAAFTLFAAVQVSSCKGKEKKVEPQTTTQSADTSTPPPPAPVVISPDEQLTNNVKDAIKDFPGVTATVSNGEITLTGDITRSKLQTLMSSLQALHPKKINNNLTIKK